MLLISGYEQQASQTQLAETGSNIYRPRPKFFLLSLVLHCTAIVIFSLIPSVRTIQQEHPNDQFIRRNKDKIVWYRFRNKLPNVSAATKTGTFPKPRGSQLSPQAVIATSPKPKSTRQFVWRPNLKVEIQRVPSPDLIAQAPPPPSLQLPPKVEATDTILKAMAPSLAPAPRMKLRHIAAPVVPAATRRNIAPVPAPAISPSTETGDSRATLAIASLDPARKLPEFVPEGGLPGQFSKAPLTGEPVTGNTKGTASLSVPNLTVRAGELPSANEASKTILYSEVVRDLPNATLSAPLRSSSGRIPAAIDAHFGGRNVYTIVIPVDNFSTYSSDWILWFAEANPPVEDSPSIRAPIPFRKVEPLKPPVSASPVQRRLQIAALIKADGTITDASLLRPAPAALEKPALQDVVSWKFTPATRNGVPIAVNVVLEIPFNLPLESARQ